MSDPGVPTARSARWWVQKFVSAALLFAVGLGLIAAMGLAQRLGWISGGGGGSVEAAPSAEGDSVYTCPMHPQIRQPNPGSCPICGMKLVPATSSGNTDLDELAVKIEPAARRLAGIETAPVRLEVMTSTIETIGAIAIDESRLVTIPSYIDGRIEKLFADYTGVVVQKGDHLAIVYSPELYSAQVEYLVSLSKLNEDSSFESVRESQRRLMRSLRQKLVELGMTEQQISELEESKEARSRLTIYATDSGTVIEKLAVEGKYVKPGDPIYRIADLSTIWLMLELYPEDASRIRFGQRVEAEVQSLPGQTFEGRVAFIDPVVNERDRTVGVRVEFLNEDGLLRPGDYASAKIHLPVGPQGEVYDAELAGRWISPMHPQIVRDEPGQCPICGMDLIPTSQFGYSSEPVEQPASIVVPRSAVLMAGSNSVVYVETEPGRFEIRPVVLGPILKDDIIIRDGLTEGEQVAVAGNFLIDSQMQLAGKPSLIDPTRAIQAQQETTGPLNPERIDVQNLPGPAGRQIEELYAAYLSVQSSLADDQKITEEQAVRLNRTAAALADSDAIPESLKEPIRLVAEKSEHLHHMDIEQARLEAFRPISHAVIRLAAAVRGDQAEDRFTQMFCPMVEGGGGDWLQADDDLRNPYWGSAMLTCGEIVRQFPLQGSETTAADPHSGHSHDNGTVEDAPP